ncbi:MAG: phospho-N-acetylmuramoyl-pentapeptide-transferase [Bifidobacteriaceae bacterium]|jgi:phospho-N-acetylmuramoyl-pentapeptide-transferase|nr:phospho-N-acetylmuramoyl-pentapeptide-transferase [Bifidobacteriaceae bacterium]
MIAIIIALIVAMSISLFGTPVWIKFLTKHNLGQFIRSDGPQTHLIKRGTPTIGGVVIIVATCLGFGASAIFNMVSQGRPPGFAPILLLVIMILTGGIGFIDDFLKIRHSQNEGLSISRKFIIQGAVGIVIALLLLSSKDEYGLTPGNTSIHFFGDAGLDFQQLGRGVGIVLFVIWVNMLITAWTNAVNLTDGLDGLCPGVSLVSFAGYILIGMWEASQSCFDTSKSLSGTCYEVSHPFELATVCAAIVGACVGFLWWNTSPAKIFMGDTGSMALGGAFAGVSMMTHTEFLAIMIGGVFVIEVLSDVIQIGAWKLSHRRIFKMAPIHHHFELKGWQEITIVVRFWLVAAFMMTLGLVLFYFNWVFSLHTI